MHSYNIYTPTCMVVHIIRTVVVVVASLQLPNEQQKNMTNIIIQLWLIFSFSPSHTLDVSYSLRSFGRIVHVISVAVVAKVDSSTILEIADVNYRIEYNILFQKLSILIYDRRLRLNVYVFVLRRVANYSLDVAKVIHNDFNLLFILVLHIYIYEHDTLCDQVAKT